MNKKRFTLIAMVLAITALFAGMVVSAQDDDTTFNGKRGGRGFKSGVQHEIILEATGLTSQELRTALQDGSTIAELIEANGGDVDSVIADLVELATAHINTHVEEGRLPQERADTILDNLEENITNRLHGTFERPEGFGSRRGGRGFGFGPGNNGNPPADDNASSDSA